jgi:hypothetical protein
MSHHNFFVMCKNPIYLISTFWSMNKLLKHISTKKKFLEETWPKIYLRKDPAVFKSRIRFNRLAPQHRFYKAVWRIRSIFRQLWLVKMFGSGLFPYTFSRKNLSFKLDFYSEIFIVFVQHFVRIYLAGAGKSRQNVAAPPAQASQHCYKVPVVSKNKNPPQE